MEDNIEIMVWSYSKVRKNRAEAREREEQDKAGRESSKVRIRKGEKENRDQLQINEKLLG